MCNFPSNIRWSRAGIELLCVLFAYVLQWLANEIPLRLISITSFILPGHFKDTFTVVLLGWYTCRMAVAQA